MCVEPGVSLFPAIVAFDRVRTLPSLSSVRYKLAISLPALHSMQGRPPFSLAFGVLIFVLFAVRSFFVSLLA